MHLAALALLLFWPEAQRMVPSREALSTFSLSEPPPPQPPPPPAPRHGEPRAAQAEGAAGKKAAPRPAIAKAIPIIQPSVSQPPQPASGDDASRGAALAGAGPGAGGQGNGPGGGGTGGDGDGGGVAEPAEWIGGEIRKASDYPRRARTAGLQGTVETEIAVGANGRPTGCSIVRSSGSPELDQTTCQLIMRRFRFRPARDRLGRAIPDIVGYDHAWIFERGGEE